MKNEDRIIELLSEYLQKTDRILDRLDKHDELFGKQLERMDIAYQVLIRHSEQIEGLQKESKELRQESLKYSVQNDALLREILSISKRVSTIEEPKK